MLANFWLSYLIASPDLLYTVAKKKDVFESNFALKNVVVQVMDDFMSVSMPPITISLYNKLHNFTYRWLFAHLWLSVP